jgi:hypothetical protein
VVARRAGSGLGRYAGIAPDPDAVTVQAMMASVVEQAMARHVMAVEAVVAEHMEGHSALEYVRALVAAQAERDRLRPWRHHWRHLAIAKGVVLDGVRQLHQPAMFGGLPTGRCACGGEHPCATRQAVGPGRPVWEGCDCAADCPAQHDTDPYTGEAS